MYHNATLRTYFDKSTYTPLAEKNNGVNGQYGIDIAEIGRTSSKSFNHDTSAQISFNSSLSPIGNSSSQSNGNGNGNGISHGGSFAKLETQSSIKFKRNRSSSFSNKYK